MKNKKVTVEDKKVDVKDNLVNLVAGLGTSGDKRTHSSFKNSKQLGIKGNNIELSDMYRTDWLTGKIVDIIPDEMCREWRSFTGNILPEDVKILENEENRLGLREAFNMANKWARLYGNGFVVLSVDDGKDPSEPLDIRTLKKGCLKHIKAIDRHRLEFTDQMPVLDPLSANFGKPEYYRFVDTSVKIHHSRLLRFEGLELPFDELRRNNYFSDSIISRIYDTLINFHTVTNACASLIYKNNVDVIKVKGLINALSSPEGAKILEARFAQANILKSLCNTTLLDSEEELQNLTVSFAGMHELIDKYGLLITGASDIPATKLMGSSASGLNATGEGDAKNFYDTISANQIKSYKPKLDYFDQIMSKSLGRSEDIDLSYTFNSLFQMSEKEQAEIGNLRAQRDVAYLQSGVIDEDIILKELQQDNIYTNITDDYISEYEKEDDEMLNKLEENAITNT